MDASNTRIVILGKTGTGKSSLANTIFGEKWFKCAHSLDTETKRCQAETKFINGRSLTLIDTPGFFDTDGSDENPEIVRCITECAPGPHVFLIVLKVEKVTEHEQAVVDKIHEYFSEEVFKYAAVVFTHGDQLHEGQTIEDFVHQNIIVSDLVKECGGRCHVIDNKYWKYNQQDEYRTNGFQVDELLKTIDKITEANNRRCYTNEMLQAVEEKIQQEEERIRLIEGNMSEEEIRKQARICVSTSVVFLLAGAVTGGLLSYFFGVMKDGVAKMLMKGEGGGDRVSAVWNATKKAATALMTRGQSPSAGIDAGDETVSFTSDKMDGSDDPQRSLRELKEIPRKQL